MSGSTGEYPIISPRGLCEGWVPGRRLRPSKGSGETWEGEGERNSKGDQQENKCMGQSLGRGSWGEVL